MRRSVTFVKVPGRSVRRLASRNPIDFEMGCMCAKMRLCKGHREGYWKYLRSISCKASHERVYSVCRQCTEHHTPLSIYFGLVSTIVRSSERLVHRKYSRIRLLISSCSLGYISPSHFSSDGWSYWTMCGTSALIFILCWNDLSFDTVGQIPVDFFLFCFRRTSGDNMRMSHC